MMEIYECSKGSGKTVIVLDKKEGQTLFLMAEAAATQNKRKRSWACMFDKLRRYLACF